jgi:hypothetical protein
MRCHRPKRKESIFLLLINNNNCSRKLLCCALWKLINHPSEISSILFQILVVQNGRRYWRSSQQFFSLGITPN